MATRLGNTRVLLASAKPATATTLPIIGNTGMGPPDGTTSIATYVQDMATLGVTMNRTYISWNVVNPSSGVFDWTVRQGAPDLWYTSMVNAGLTPIFQHIFAPTWWFLYNGWSPSDRPYADFPPYPSADWDYFLARNIDAATAAATRYPLAIIEIQNEFNNAGIYCRPGGQVVACTPANYAAFHAPIQAAYKAVNPGQKVIIGGLLRMDSAPVFSSNGNYSGISALAPIKTALDALSCTPDGVSIHPYLLGAPNSDPTIDRWPNTIGINSWQSTGRTLDEMDRIGWNLPVYVTETGFRASQSNAQGAFNCNSESTKSIWNRYEHDAMFYLYSKPARKAGKSWVEAMMYYRDQEYPSPTSPTYCAAISADPPAGPHTLTTWGASLIDFATKVKNRQRIPKLEGLTLTCPSSAVIGQSAATISAAGTNLSIVATFRTSNASVVAITPPATGSSTTTISFPGSGTASITAQSRSATGLYITASQTIVVDAQIPTTSVITPGSGWNVATSNSGTIPFVVTETDQIGNPIVSPVGAWSSSDPANAPIDPVTGVLTAVGLSAGVVVTWTPVGGAPGATVTSTGNVVLNPVLQITNAPTTLINIGLVALTVTDGASPVTGCTIVASDPTKITVVGQTIFGLGTAGTSTIKAQKVGYGDSSLSTVTSTGDAGGLSTYSYLDDKDGLGLSNGAAVSTYTDVGGNTWSQATGSKQPTYTTGAINGHAAITFDGVDDVLKATATATVLNNTEFTYMALMKPTNAGAVANEQWLDNRNSTAGQQGGFVLGRNITTFANDLSYYVPGPTLQQQFDGAGMATNTWTVLIDRVSQGSQNRMLDGVVVGTSRTDATYLNPTTNPPLPTKGGNISQNAGNNFQGPVAIEGLINRYVSDAERLQIYARAKLYGAL